MAKTAAPPSLLPLAQRIAILVSGVLTVALYFTSILVASTVLPQMQGTFAATADEISWVMTFNILATAIAMPMTGWWVSRFGRRRVMVWSTAVFTASTLMCGLSTSLETLILWRIVQGAAGAPSVPLVQTILLDTFPPNQHSMVLGMYGMGVVLGPIIGPTMGGYLAEVVNWRWAFHVMVPVGIMATLGLAAALPRDILRGHARLSWIGFILLSVAIGGMQLMLARGERLDWFDAMEIRITLFLSVVAFYLFLAHSLLSTRPFLDLRLLLDRNFSLGLVLVTLFGMLNFTPMVLLPTLMRTHLGFPDQLVGQVVGSRGLGGIFGFFAVIFLSRRDPRISVGLGFLLQAAAGYWLMNMSVNTTAFELCLNGAVQGLSSGIIVVALTLVTFAGVTRDRMPEATAVYHLLRNIGASFFISICVTEVVHSTGTNYSRLIENVSYFNRAFELPWVTGMWDIGTPTGLMRFSREVGKQAAVIAYINAFGLFTTVSAVALPLVLLLRGVKRRPA